MLRVNIKRLAMESPFNHFRYFGFIIIISLGLAQDDSTAIVTPGILKSQEAETVTISASVKLIDVRPTAYRLSVYPRSHPTESFIQKLYFPDEPIQIILPANILNSDSLGNIAKLEPLGDAYDVQYRMFNADVGEIALSTFNILPPADILKLTVLNERTDEPIPNCDIVVSQGGLIFTNITADTSGYARVRIPINRNNEIPVLLTIDSRDLFPIWRAKINVPIGDSEKTVNISPIKLQRGETVYYVTDDLSPFRKSPENGAAILFLLNKGDHVAISKTAGDRLFGRVRVFIDRQNKYQSVNGWILRQHIIIGK